MQKSSKQKFFPVIMIVLLTGFLMAITGCDTTPTEPEDAVAEVNGSPINLKTLTERAHLMELRLEREGREITEEDKASIRSEALNDLIRRELLYQKSQELEIEVDDQMINGQIAQLKDRFGSEEEFDKALEKQGINQDQMFTDFKHTLINQLVLEQEVMGDLEVTDQEAKQYFDDHPDVFTIPEQVRAQHILIEVADDADQQAVEDARSRIEQIKQRVDNGEDFASLAKEVSEGPSSERGGDLGFFNRGQMDPAFEKAAFALPEGEVSDIVRTSFGFHLIKVTKHNEEQLTPFVNVLPSLKKYLLDEKRYKAQTEYVESLRNNAEIKVYIEQPEKQDKTGQAAG
ncbi:MAG: peptidylprolyl isomerase [Spirochaetales bacterium]|nr:peptidylprolyl isomerase [Spirochaetales bacterium]